MNNLPLILLLCFLPSILSQQPYIRQAITDCNSRDNSTTVLGYTCNGLQRTCQTYLTFRSQPPYNSVSSISTLFSVNPTQLSQLNSVSQTTTFQTDRTVLIPITCSCAGQHHQANTSYTIRPGDMDLTIANNTFQGLTTCQALQVQNADIPPESLFVGARLNVPLRCACPTRNQTNDGVNYLLSYIVAQGQFVEVISNIFGVDTRSTLAANGLSVTNFDINPFTTLLVPLENPPTSSQVTAPQPSPPPAVAQPPPAVPPSGGGGSKAWIYALVGAVGGVLVASAFGVVLYCVCFRKQRKKDDERVESSPVFESVDKLTKKLDTDEGFDSEEFLESISSIAQSLKVYTFQEIKTATEDFSQGCLIKGSVYRGAMNGDFAAIKKMNGDVSKEINLLNKINHFNLIRLSGVSFNEGNWYLVYEYASNGSLNDWILNKNDNPIMLDWNMRVQIALDVAAGLNYLHRYTSPPYIHKDLNSSNVLLDADFRAKIANFGLARVTEGQEGQFALTRHIVGTKGYMAPEYLENGVVSPKLDVYAFGVLLLEILTGKEVSGLNPVVSEDGAENVGHMMDPVLEGKYPSELAVMLFRLIDNCVKKDPSDRPNMDDIFQTLSRISTSVSSGEWAVSISESQHLPR